MRLVTASMRKAVIRSTAAIASVLLINAFLMLAVTNLMQARALRYTVRSR